MFKILYKPRTDINAKYRSYSTLKIIRRYRKEGFKLSCKNVNKSFRDNDYINLLNAILFITHYYYL